jgi:squalene-associated FAD-dependent desaturase
LAATRAATRAAARVAVVGAGWAGLAAAVQAVRAGHEVTLLEASRTLGGRARTLEVAGPDGHSADLDNGQHILIGAYRHTLSLMQSVGVRLEQVLHAMPLSLRTPSGQGIALPAWPSPLDAAWAVITARGWRWSERLAFLRACVGWRAQGFRCAPHASVAGLCDGMPARVLADVIEPLCVAALNTPATRASGQVFLRVLRDALFGPGHGSWGASWLLLPRAPLGRLMPEAAATWLASRGATLRSGHRVALIARTASGWQVDADRFDAVVLACPSWDAIRLLEDNAVQAPAWLALARQLRHEAIATVYAQGARSLPAPMLRLQDGPHAPAQFVFDRGQLGGPAGLLAFVASACQGEREVLQQQVIAQAHALGWHEVRPLRTVVEKRATFACTPALVRPGIAIDPGLWACGDWVEGPYPATLEGAVISGQRAVAALSAALRTTG